MVRLVPFIVMIVLTVVPRVAADAEAPSPGWAYVFVDPRPEHGFREELPFSYNSTGGAITARLSGSGYKVFLGGLSEHTPSGFVGGIAHVTAFDRGYCNIGGWTPVDAADARGPGTELLVHCFDDSGAPTITGMALTFSNDRNAGPVGTLAWLSAGPVGGSIADWAAIPEFSYNSTGGANTVNRLGPGVFAVNLPGVSLLGGTAQVTAQGADNGYCNVGNWAERIVRTELEVRCFDDRGVLSDHAFTLTFAVNVSPVGSGASRAAYTFVSDGFSLIPRVGEREHQHNSAGDRDDVYRAGSPRGRSWIGSYQVWYRGLSRSGVVPYPVPMAGAYGSNAHCRPTGFAHTIDQEVVVSVLCTSPNAVETETDSAFVVQFIGSPTPVK